MTILPKPAVLFDLDETLIHEERCNIEAYDLAAAWAAKQCSIESARLIAAIRTHADQLWQAGPYYTFLDGIGLASWEGLWSDFEGNAPSFDGPRQWVQPYRCQAWSHALAACGVKNPDLGEKLAHYFLEQRRQIHHPFPETIAVLQQLRPQYQLGIITNGSADIQWLKLEALGLKDFFDAVIVSAELGIGKPHPQIFTVALERLHVQPHQAIMVGNSLRRDILGARNAAIRSVLIKTTDPESSIDITPDAAIDTLNQLLPLAAQWL